MDDIESQLSVLQADIEEEEEEAEEEATYLAAITTAVLVLGAEAARQQRINNQHPSRLYLQRGQLLPNPRWNTPWIQLVESRNDRAYITTMGFDVTTFESILSSGFERMWYTQSIPRSDGNIAGEPRPGGRSLDARGGLGLVLHYLNSCMREISLQQIFALVPATVTRYVGFGLQILLEVLRSMEDAAIRWPQNRPEFQKYSDLIVARHPRLSGAFATIDGLNLPVQTSDDLDIENATYNGWLSEHFISSVLVFSPEGTIIASRSNAPGSWHNSRVAQPIYKRLCSDTPDGFYIVADTAFPRGARDIEGHIEAPLKAGQRIQGSQADIDEKLQYNRELLSYRQTAEWGMRLLQGSFGRLRVPLEINHTDRRGDLLEICFRLTNLRTRRVGYNQIQTVYVQQWKRNGDDTEIWNDFESILFGDQRRKDRVSRFHIHPEYDDDAQQ